MTMADTDITLEELLDHMPIPVQYVDKNGFLRYLNKAAAARPANAERKVGVNIKDCHARPESLERIKHVFEDFKRGRREPHFYITSTGNMSMKVPVFNAEGEFIGVLAYTHPTGLPTPDRTF